MSTAGRTLPPSRVLIVLTVLAVAVLMLAVPIRELFRQRTMLADLNSKAASSQARVDRLTEQRQRWNDPSYVQGQARARLHFVMPGEVGFLVTGTDAKGVEVSLTPEEDPPRAVPPTWYEQVWGSVEGAGEAVTPKIQIRPEAPR